MQLRSRLQDILIVLRTFHHDSFPSVFDHYFYSCNVSRLWEVKYEIYAKLSLIKKNLWIKSEDCIKFVCLLISHTWFVTIILTRDRLCSSNRKVFALARTLWIIFCNWRDGGCTGVTMPGAPHVLSCNGTSVQPSDSQEAGAGTLFVGNSVTCSLLGGTKVERWEYQGSSFSLLKEADEVLSKDRWNRTRCNVSFDFLLLQYVRNLPTIGEY